MAKFFKRIGAKAYKFHVDIYLRKLELDINDNENSECLIILKRGFSEK